MTIEWLVFIYDSSIEPWHGVEIEKVQRQLREIERRGVGYHLVDTKNMPQEQVRSWRERAALVAQWHHHRIRTFFGNEQAHLGKRVPALFAYEEYPGRPLGVYPHEERAEGSYITISIEEFLDDLLATLEDNQ
jgi:hypothetical protein